jgi:hypothetical protein
MFLMDHRAFGTPFFRTPERRAQRHANRDPDSQPDRNVPGQHSRNRAQCRS